MGDDPPAGVHSGRNPPSQSTSEFRESAPWSASIGALLLAASALYRLSLDGQRPINRLPNLAAFGGEITISPLVKGGLVGLALVAVAFAIGIRWVDWGPIPLRLTELGVVLSMGHLLQVATAQWGLNTVQYRRVALLSFAALAMFAVALFVTARARETDGSAPSGT